MSRSTTLKRPDELKDRIRPLAQQAGKTPHAWMVEALEREATRLEARASFVQDALAAAEATDHGGPVFAAADVHERLRAKLSGRRINRPKPLPRHDFGR